MVCASPVALLANVLKLLPNAPVGMNFTPSNPWGPIHCAHRRFIGHPSMNLEIRPNHLSSVDLVSPPLRIFAVQENRFTGTICLIQLYKFASIVEEVSPCIVALLILVRERLLFLIISCQ